MTGDRVRVYRSGGRHHRRLAPRSAERPGGRPAASGRADTAARWCEKVWRAWYGGDTAALAELLPEELMTVGPGRDGFTGRDGIVAASKRFAEGGGTFVRLDFPRTEIQAYGATAIIYTSYELDVAEAGKRRNERGKATEVFVRRAGRWLNTGWQLAPQTASTGAPRPDQE